MICHIAFRLVAEGEMWYYVSSLTTIRRFSLKMKTVLSVVTTAMAAVLCSTSLAEGHAISAVKIQPICEL